MRTVLNWISDLIYWEREAMEKLTKDPDWEGFETTKIDSVSEVGKDSFTIKLKDNKKYRIKIEEIINE